MRATLVIVPAALLGWYGGPFGFVLSLAVVPLLSEVVDRWLR
jgi:hypothetical protein